MSDAAKPPLKREPPNRREASPLVHYVRVAASEARRMRRGFTRENLIEFLRTLLWVVPLTILIWIYAEREQIQKEPDVTVEIDARSDDPNRMATLIKPADKNITVTLEGSRSRLDRVRELLSPQNAASGMLIHVPRTAPVGQESPLQTREQISDNPIFKANGVTVVSCSPEYLVVLVDRIDELEIPIKAPSDLPGLQEATFKPGTVKLRGPHLLLEKLKNEPGGPVAIAELKGRPELLQPGTHNLPAVSISPSSTDPALTLSMTSVQATVVTGEPSVTYTLHNLPVLLQAPGTILDQYHISYGTILPEVTVKGPPDAIEQIKSGAFKPIAVLQVTAEDIANPQPRKVSIQNLPEGVREDPNTLTPVRFTISERG